MNITCRELTDAAADVLGAEASPERRAALLRHLADCTRCAHELDGLEQVLATTRRLGVPEPGPAYWQSYRVELRQRIDATPADPGPGWRTLLGAWLRPLAATAAMAVVALIAARDLPAPGLLPAAPAELAAADLDEAHALSRALDTLALSDSTPLEEDALVAGLESPSLESTASGELFDFFGSAATLTPSDERKLVAALEQDSRG